MYSKKDQTTIKINNFYSLGLIKEIQQILTDNDPAPVTKSKLTKKKLLLLLFDPKRVEDLANLPNARKQAWKFYNQLRIRVIQNIRRVAEYSYFSRHETAFRQDMNYSTWRVSQWRQQKNELFYYPLSVKNHDGDDFFHDTFMIEEISRVVKGPSSLQIGNNLPKANRMRYIITATILSLGLFLVLNELIKEYQDNRINHSYLRLATLITAIVISEAVAASAFIYLPILIGLTLSTGGLAAGFAFGAYAAFSLAAIFGTLFAKFLLDCLTPDRYELTENEQNSILTTSQNVTDVQTEIRIYETAIRNYGYTFFGTDTNEAVNEMKTAIYSLRNQS